MTSFEALIENARNIVVEHTVLHHTPRGERPALSEEGGRRLHAATMGFLEAWQPGQVSNPPLYPFVGEKLVRARLETAPFEVHQAICLMMWSLQTLGERAERDTEARNRAGFMSSDAWTGSLIAEAIASGRSLSEKESDWLLHRACSGRGMRGYAKQLSVQLRGAAMARDPRLAAYAATFSIR